MNPLIRTVGLLLAATCNLAGCQRAEPLPATGPSPEVTFTDTPGGPGAAQVRDVACDAQGNAVVVGGTSSTGFEVTTGAAAQGSYDVFVIKYGPDGRRLWSRLMGGPAYDRAYAVEMDASGFVYVGGRAGPGYPTTPGALQTEFGGDQDPNRAYGPQDGFVTKLTPDGDRVVWSTYFGGGDKGFLRDLDVDAAGRVHVALCAASLDQPHVTPGAFQPRRPAAPFGVVARLAADGGSVEWGTYLGGEDGGYAMGTPTLRVAGNGDAVVVSHAGSANLPTTDAAHDRVLDGRSDMYVARISSDGSQLVFGTYLGGAGIEYGDTHNGVLDADGNIVIAATTRSADFPVTPGVFQVDYGGSGGSYNQTGDGFVAVLAGDGRTLLRATFLGGSSGEGIEGVALGADGDVIVSGGTYSSDFPRTAGTPEPNGPHDRRPEAFVTRLRSSLEAAVHSRLLGGSDWDLGLAVAVSGTGAVWVGGETRSTDLPGAPGIRAGDKAGLVIRLEHR